MEATLAMLSDGRLRLRELITHVMRPADAASAYRMIGEKTHPHSGVAFDWMPIAQPAI